MDKSHKIVTFANGNTGCDYCGAPTSSRRRMSKPCPVPGNTSGHIKSGLPPFVPGPERYVYG